MSEADRRKINKLLKQKKYGSEVTGSFTYSFRWPIYYYDLNDNYNYILSNTFKLLDSEWLIKLYPNGIDNNNDYISVFLICNNSNDVYAHYSIKLLDDENNIIHTWKEPERIVKFSNNNNSDNEWGNDEFYDIELLNINNNKLTITIDIEVFGRDDLNKETLSLAVMNANETKELMKIADEEIHEVVKKLPALRDSIAQKKQEDSIIVERAPPPVVEKKNNIFLS